MKNSHLNLELYKKMFLIRRSEEKIIEFYPEDEMKTPMHMSMGGEAISAGVCQALRSEDQVFGTYRSHGIFLAKTGDTNDFFAEMYGKDTALLKGKGGSMHMCAPDHGFMGTSGIVATAIPVAVGAAFANKTTGNNRVVAVFFGDGATDEGVFWESLNVACLMKLPIVFVCEDNGFAVHTPGSDRRGYRSLPDIVSKFHCHVLTSKSTDAEEIYELFLKGLGLMRETESPLFFHCKYYRYLEHVGVNEDFSAGYRSKEEFLKWHKRDPVRCQRSKLKKAGYSEKELKEIEKSIDEKIMKSLLRAKEASYCDISELTKEVIG
jgi:TPP-dependent pyruvate/acetoin dehydrogenase alpha subunit